MTKIKLHYPSGEVLGFLRGENGLNIKGAGGSRQNALTVGKAVYTGLDPKCAGSRDAKHKLG